jgi:predicted phage terminase large subunit-like protein
VPRTLSLELPPLHPAQRQLLAHPARFKTVVAGRRWGKSRFGVALAVATAVEGKRVWWVAPTYAVSGIAWRLCKALLRAVPGVDLREGDRAVVLPGGGEVWFKSSDRPDNLRGEGLDLLVMDEADFQDGSTWTEVLRPALADRKGKALFISTPKVEGGWFHELFRKGQRGEEGWASWSYPSWTNPFLDPQEIEAARADLPSIEFRREFGAEFVSAAGARVKAEWVRYAPSAPPDLDVALGVDLAISERQDADYTALVALGRDRKSGRTYVLDARRGRMSFDKILSFIREAAALHSPRVIAIETQQFQAAVVGELLRTTTLPVRGVRADRDKLTRFLPLEARYEQGLVYHLTTLPRDFEQELCSFPVSAHDDYVDAAAYAYAALATDFTAVAKSLRKANAAAPHRQTRSTW